MQTCDKNSDHLRSSILIDWMSSDEMKWIACEKAATHINSQNYLQLHKVVQVNERLTSLKNSICFDDYECWFEQF